MSWLDDISEPVKTAPGGGKSALAVIGEELPKWWEGVNPLKEVRESFPRAYGAVGGFLGTAPDEFQRTGSVLAPDSKESQTDAAVRAGAEVGYPVGIGAQLLPLAGPALKGARAIAEAPSVIPGSRAAQRGIIKAPGGDWISGSVEDSLKSLKHAPSGEAVAEAANVPLHLFNTLSAEERLAAGRRALSPQDSALNNWVDRKLTPYVKNYMGTEADPIRKLAEEGITHKHIPITSDGQRALMMHKREEAGFPIEGSGKSSAARSWEDRSDRAITVGKPGTYLDDYKLDGSEVSPWLKDNPWLEKLPPDTPVSKRNIGVSSTDLGFDHIMDVLREQLASGELTVEQLGKVTVEQAVRRTHAYDQAAAKKAAEFRAKAAESAPVVQKFDNGDKLIQLNAPGQFAAESDAMGHSVRGYEPPKGHADWTKESVGGSSSYGHGGWEGIKSGKAEVYSLRDAKNGSHATIEMSHPAKPQFGEEAIDYRELRPENFIKKYGYDPDATKIPPNITQIKGPGNRAIDPSKSEQIKQFLNSKPFGRVNLDQLQGVHDLTDRTSVSKLSDDIYEATGNSDRAIVSHLQQELEAKGLPRFVSRGDVLKALEEPKPLSIPSGTKQRGGIKLSDNSKPLTADQVRDKLSEQYSDASREEFESAVQSYLKHQAAGSRLWHGGTYTAGEELTRPLYLGSQKMAESYVDMANDRGMAGKLNEFEFKPKNPAPEKLVMNLARQMRMDVEYTPASLFDDNLQDPRMVEALSNKLKLMGYDSAIMRDIGYGIQHEEPVTVVLPGAKLHTPKALGITGAAGAAGGAEAAQTKDQPMPSAAWLDDVSEPVQGSSSPKRGAPFKAEPPEDTSYDMSEYAPPVNEGRLDRIKRLAKQTARESSTAEGAALLGGGEAALQAATGLGATALGGLAGIAGSVLPGEPGQGARWSQAVQKAGTYQPKSSAGQLASEMLSAPLTLASEYASKGAPLVAGAALNRDLTPQETAAMESVGGAAIPAAATLAGAPALLKGGKTPRVPVAGEDYSLLRDLTPEQRERLTRQKALGVQPTLGSVTRTPEQHRFESQTAKMPEGAAIAARQEENDAAIVKAVEDTDKMRTGRRQTENEREAGHAVSTALEKKAQDSLKNVSQLYTAARDSGETKAVVDTKPLESWLKKNEAKMISVPELRTIQTELNTLKRTKKGAVTIDDIEELYKSAGSLGKPGEASGKFMGDVKSQINDLTEGAGGDLYRQARAARLRHAFEFEDRGAIARLIEKKPGSRTDYKTANEDVFRKTVLNSSLTELQDVTNSLLSADPKAHPQAIQAVRELQAQTIDHLLDRATNNVSEGFSPAAYRKAVRDIGRDKLNHLLGKDAVARLDDILRTGREVKVSPGQSIGGSDTFLNLKMEAARIAQEEAKHHIVGMIPYAGRILKPLREWQAKKQAAVELQTQVGEALTPSRASAPTTKATAELERKKNKQYRLSEGVKQLRATAPGAATAAQTQVEDEENQ